MSEAVAFLQEHFPRYKPIKGPPNLSWNEATLHAMYLNGIYYHAASIRKGPDYSALYKSVLDAADDFEREKLYARGIYGGLRYYPFYHSDASGEAWVYSVDYFFAYNALWDPAEVGPALRQYAIDWWTPVLVATHYSGFGISTAIMSPEGWMQVTEALMDSIDHDSHPWRRWVDTYDYAKNIQRFDQDLTVNSISICGSAITYDITAGEPVRYVTLKTEANGLVVHSVTLNGAEYRYFGDNYVHLPELYGNTVIVVNLGSPGNDLPHVTHISPNAEIENATCENDRLDLTLSGDFEATVRVAGSNRAFGVGATEIFGDDTEQVKVDVSSHTHDEQIELCLVPATSSVSVEPILWDISDRTERLWLECSACGGLTVTHIVGDLEANSCYLVVRQGCPIDTCISNSSGGVTFTCCQCGSTCAMEVVIDSTAAAVPHCDQPRNPLVTEMFVTNHPNPISSGTVLCYGLPKRSPITLRIYSADGRLIRTLAEGAQPGGVHSAYWDGLDAQGCPVSPGVYLCRLRTLREVGSRKVVLIR